MTQILLVDDSSVIRKVARRICEGMNLQTAEADSGPAAIEACQDVMPDAILLDWNMPIMDGFEVLREVRRMPGGHRPKILLCTTENDPTHISRAMLAGADGYLMKPFDPETVRAKLEEIALV